ncbi:MAG: DUF1178 family protein [Gammaproteobacteria bacterium]|nr:DUF1178 family protein [Gammaproteobacteria bacterium]
MVIYDLICDAKHRFEGWFQSPEDSERQAANGLISCPTCGSVAVRKLPTAARLNRGERKDSEQVEVITGRQASELLRRLHDFVDENFEDVGHEFADQARRMHYGSEKERNIRGMVDADEARSLEEEGVPALSLPPRPVDPEKLN